SHASFRDLPSFLSPGDCLVLNRSAVRKARLPARKLTGGKAELLLVSPVDGSLTRWKALGRKLSPGTPLELPDGAGAEIEGLADDASLLVRFSVPLTAAWLDLHGEAPLPGYIVKSRRRLGLPEERPDDKSLYQTVYAAEEGSIAAPTAGFHFTPALLDAVSASGVDTAYVTLHVGWGTFRPVRTANPSEHVMLPESCEVSAVAAEKVNSCLSRGGRVIAVGTSSMRTLETLAGDDGRLSPGKTDATLFIYPGHKFKTAAGFITNLHVPGSAPLYMTAAFAGEEKLYAAYAEAVKEKYRFYSYGDAMLIL
ncbi:MAG TPA: S-adenosylmethionine:tRNA ribosyltransferase-isomerase, partial [Elusimicrobiales bacterium]|nr:S-adenosylmethionine:tRNA ribosyltransferase-isomerase [Elusimicrobiales bacterium]